MTTAYKKHPTNIWMHPRVKRDMHACQALSEAIEQRRVTISTMLGVALTRYRRDLRKHARHVGLDPDKIIRDDSDERDARHRGEQPRTVASAKRIDLSEVVRDTPIID